MTCQSLNERLNAWEDQIHPSRFSLAEQNAVRSQMCGVLLLPRHSMHCFRFETYLQDLAEQRKQLRRTAFRTLSYLVRVQASMWHVRRQWESGMEEMTSEALAD